jgi:hypothetical protein
MFLVGMLGVPYIFKVSSACDGFDSHILHLIPVYFKLSVNCTAERDRLLYRDQWGMSVGSHDRFAICPCSDHHRNSPQSGGIYIILYTYRKFHFILENS